jgi:AraC-like DNA-binding protein
MRTSKKNAPMASVYYINLLIEVATRLGVTQEVLLAESGLTAADLEQSDNRVDYYTFGHLLKRAVLLTREPGLGFLMGLQMKASNHGLLGYAAMVSSTMGEALALAQRYIEIQTATVQLRTERAGQDAILHIEQRLPDFPLNEIVIQFMMVGFTQMAKMLTGQQVRGHAEMSIDRPDYFDRFVDILPGEVRFGQSRNALVFPASALDLPLIMADAIASKISTAQCERDLSQLVDNRTLGQVVRDMAFDTGEGFLSLEQVAEKLHVTPRTLQRRLAEESLVYNDMVSDMRKSKAQQLLSQGKSVQDVALHLGYSDATNFSRAFRRWTGDSPRQFQDRG